MYEIGEICFGGYLCVVSMWDIRKREIPVWLIAAGGILSASLGYFQKEPGQMNDYESTLLAGIPNAPSAYAPTKNPETRQTETAASVRDDGKK